MLLLTNVVCTLFFFFVLFLVRLIGIVYRHSNSNISRVLYISLSFLNVVLLVVLAKNNLFIEDIRVMGLIFILFIPMCELLARLFERKVKSAIGLQLITSAFLAIRKELVNKMFSLEDNIINNKYSISEWLESSDFLLQYKNCSKHLEKSIDTYISNIKRYPNNVSTGLLLSIDSIIKMLDALMIELLSNTNQDEVNGMFSVLNNCISSLIDVFSKLERGDSDVIQA